MPRGQLPSRSPSPEKYTIMIAMNLPNAPSWKFKGHMVANRIFRKGRYINLDTISDAQVEALMKKEPDYWKNHFAPVEKAEKAKPEKKGDSPKS